MAQARVSVLYSRDDELEINVDGAEEKVGSSKRRLLSRLQITDRNSRIVRELRAEELSAVARTRKVE